MIQTTENKEEKAIQTVGSFLYTCLKNEGLTDIFGVPGDYNFALLDLLEADDQLTFINARNELNAGYAADGYARLKGLSALITTFGVGELSTANAIAGANCENIPIIHIVGAPDSHKQENQELVHHTLMNGDFYVFKRMFEEISAYSAVLTPENAAIEIPKAIQIAKEKKKPVYLMVADDLVTERIVERETKFDILQEDKQSFDDAMNHVKERIQTSSSTVLLADTKSKSFQLEKIMEGLAEALHIPVACMMYGKGAFDESHSHYIGIYAGDFGEESVKAVVEQADCVIAVGLVWADTNTANFTATIEQNRLIDVQPYSVKIGTAQYNNIKAIRFLEELSHSGLRQMKEIPDTVFPYDNGTVEEKDTALSASNYYPIIQDFIKARDVVITETGTFFYGLSQARMKKEVSYIKQGGWQSIGFATAATFGACIAEPDRRVLLFTGDGSLQLTAQEISSMLSHGCKPILFVLNNKGYTIEKFLNTETKNQAYNNIPDWSYSQLPNAFGGEAYSTVVSTVGEFKEALKQAEIESKDKLCLIEMKIDDPMDGPDYVKQIRAHKKQ
ncbi:indolepyruvate decarboxylase [Alkalihalobacillus xiaoxiensis]|uniref:Alpha-keto-acid decarboxylase n=1 Tax=Shouchella xiaoxiensis TaxID=766895 RepID=A0ABS2T0A7_9BACI|nr:thiamine pyrophosphate-binding protein [Shouchella xiaoxiensis]MBM7841221.1 indolepyruvate decarboxylase [Shouchella xiaoxiensis]